MSEGEWAWKKKDPAEKVEEGQRFFARYFRPIESRAFSRLSLTLPFTLPGSGHWRMLAIQVGIMLVSRARRGNLRVICCDRFATVPFTRDKIHSHFVDRTFYVKYSGVRRKFRREFRINKIR